MTADLYVNVEISNNQPRELASVIADFYFDLETNIRNHFRQLSSFIGSTLPSWVLTAA